MLPLPDVSAVRLHIASPRMVLVRLIVLNVSVSEVAR
jgi:hypothetical protein